MSSLLADIEAFLAAAKMSPTTFGREAMGDPCFMNDLRGGRRLWPETEQKAREYMRKRLMSVGARA